VLDSAKEAENFAGSSHLEVDIVGGSLFFMIVRVESEILDQSEYLSKSSLTVSRLLVLASKPKKVFKYDINSILFYYYLSA